MEKKKTIDIDEGVKILTLHGFNFSNADKDFISYRKRLVSSKKAHYRNEVASVSVMYLHHSKCFVRVIHIHEGFKDREYIDLCEKALEKWEKIKAELEAEGMVFGDD